MYKFIIILTTISVLTMPACTRSPSVETEKSSSSSPSIYSHPAEQPNYNLSVEIAEGIKNDPSTGIFVATNRIPTDLEKGNFSDNKGNNLWYGAFYQIRENVSGKIILNKKKLHYDKLNSKAFYNDIRILKDKAQRFKNHVLIFVHGFNVPPTEAMVTAIGIRTMLNFDGPVVLFMWPSKSGLSKYGQNRITAESSDTAFAKFLCEISNQTTGSNYTLISHSMGNYLYANTMYNIQKTCPNLPKLKTLIMLSPDLPISLDGKIDAIPNYSENVTAYVTSKDSALSTSELAWQTPSFGLVHDNNPHIIPGIYSIDISSLQNNFDIINFNHDPYNYKMIMQDIYLTIKDNKIEPSDRNNLNIKTKGKNGYYYIMNTDRKQN